jgi:hypothetical protein
MPLKKGFQSFVADACGFLYCDLVWPLEEAYWRVDRNLCFSRAAQRERKVKSTTAIG